MPENKYLGIAKNAAAIVGIVTVLLGGAYKLFDLDGRAHTSQSARFEAEKIIEVLDPVKMAQQAIRDSANTVNAIKSRNKRDSIFQVLLDDKKVQDSLRVKQDSLRKLDSDQIYQIKEEFKGIKEELESQRH